VSDMANKINISCYTEYQSFGPSLIYNTFNNKPINFSIQDKKPSSDKRLQSTFV